MAEVTLSNHFVLKGIKPGKIIVPGFGAIDFSQPVPNDVLHALYLKNIPYLDLTPQGIAHYNALIPQPPQQVAATTTPKAGQRKGPATRKKKSKQ